VHLHFLVEQAAALRAYFPLLQHGVLSLFHLGQEGANLVTKLLFPLARRGNRAWSAKELANLPAEAIAFTSHGLIGNGAQAAAMALSSEPAGKARRIARSRCREPRPWHCQGARPVVDREVGLERPAMALGDSDRGGRQLGAAVVQTWSGGDISVL
jgi:hypothetical protein